MRVTSERRERIDERVGLATAALVERTQAVVSLPLGAVAGPRVPDQQQASAPGGLDRAA